MTVEELINFLLELPLEANVIVDKYSDYEHLDKPVLIKNTDKKIVLRNGRYMYFYKELWNSEEIPNFVTVVHLHPE